MGLTLRHWLRWAMPSRYDSALKAALWEYRRAMGQLIQAQRRSHAMLQKRRNGH